MHQYSIDDIINRTALSRSIINKCNRRLSPILSRFRIQGPNNKLLYNDDGLQMWDVIKQEKGKGSNIRQIQMVLESIVQPNGQPEQSTNETKTTDPDNQPTKSEKATDHTALFISRIDEGHHRELETKDRMIDMLAGNLKLLEEGRERRVKREDDLRAQVNALNIKATTKEAATPTRPSNSTGYRSSSFPQRQCNILGVRDFILSPSPAASMIPAKSSMFPPLQLCVKKVCLLGRLYQWGWVRPCPASCLLHVIGVGCP